jgi:hypothetical protein
MPGRLNTSQKPKMNPTDRILQYSSQDEESAAKEPTILNFQTIRRRTFPAANTYWVKMSNMVSTFPVNIG